VCYCLKNFFNNESIVEIGGGKKFFFGGGGGGGGGGGVGGGWGGGLVIVYKVNAMNAKCDDLVCVSVRPPACYMYLRKSLTLMKSGIVGLPYSVTVKLVIVCTDRAS